MFSGILVRSFIITCFIALAVSAAVIGFRPEYVGTRKGKADENYIRSENCRTCHEDHYATWRNTHHSRMTQAALVGNVQGDFTVDNRFEYLGVSAAMEKRGDRFFISFQYPDGRFEKNEIVRLVGSRRIEQYLAQRNGQFYRLPIAYDLENKRWMSLNGSFFFPDDASFDQHRAQWDTNCVFCHNVKAQPNFDFSKRLAKTEVAELGIACGACHGQGAEHAEAASSPLTRAIWHFGQDSKTHIVNPLKLDTDRSMMICGHCHGQRVPEPTDRIRNIFEKGDPFNAGDDLSLFYRPVSHETKIGDVSFANRFWADGSPRLTAYEYQGVLGSKCFTAGVPGNRINCLSCHTMHDGDIKGQLTEEKRTNAACTQCHTTLSDQGSLAAHTGHPATSLGSSCYACHMPEVVSGVMSFHPTHKITIPEPGVTIQKNVPNACNQCHVDRSVNWTVDAVKRIWSGHYASLARSSDPQFDVAESIRGLFGGDALTRAMMADAITKHSDADWARPLLAEAFSTDNYPIVRFFAANGLMRKPSLIGKPDYLQHADIRALQIQLWLNAADPARLAEIRRIADGLRKTRENVDIEVGE